MGIEVIITEQDFLQGKGIDRRGRRQKDLCGMAGLDRKARHRFDDATVHGRVPTTPPDHTGRRLVSEKEFYYWLIDNKQWLYARKFLEESYRRRRISELEEEIKVGQEDVDAFVPGDASGSLIYYSNILGADIKQLDNASTPSIYTQGCLRTTKVGRRKYTTDKDVWEWLGQPGIRKHHRAQKEQYRLNLVKRRLIDAQMADYRVVFDLPEGYETNQPFPETRGRKCGTKMPRKTGQSAVRRRRVFPPQIPEIMSLTQAETLERAALLFYRTDHDLYNLSEVMLQIMEQKFPDEYGDREPEVKELKDTKIQPRIIRTVCSNAAEYIDECLRAGIIVSEEGANGGAYFYVRDHGKGNIRHLYTGLKGEERERLLDFAENLTPAEIKAVPVCISIKNALKKGDYRIDPKTAMQTIKETLESMAKCKATSLRLEDADMTYKFFEALREHTKPSQETAAYVVE